MTNKFIIKFDWNRTDTVEEEAFWNFGTHRVPCERKRKQNVETENQKQIEKKKEKKRSADMADR